MSEARATVLIVDDNPKNLQVLAEIVEKIGHEVVMALNARQAIDYLAQELPDLILLDVMMPEMDGYMLCRELKATECSREIPVIFITARADSEDVVQGFAAGGIDYLTKPFRVPELRARLSTHLSLKRHQDELRENNERLQRTCEELSLAHATISRQNEKLKEMLLQLELSSRTDVLTGIYNRRHMVEKINAEIARYRRSGHSFALISGDIDFFKSVNDKYGHDCGDLVLQAVAQVMKNLLREQDTLARWGGEEFLILLPETDVVQGTLAAERIRRQICELEVGYRGAKVSVAMTLGVVVFAEGDTIDTVLKKADDALYRGKRQGRNRVIAADAREE